MKLSELREGERASVVGIDKNEPLAARLAALGFLAGESVCLFARHPFGDPLAYLVGDSVIAMRRITASRITVKPLSPHS